MVGTNNNNIQLPPWMSIHHLPEYGVVAAIDPSSSSSKVGVAAADTDHLTSTTSSADTITVGGDEGRSSRQARRSKRKFAHPDSTASSSTSNVTKNTFTSSTSQVSASNYKSKKEIAMDSLYPPTSEEIYGHIRYLSEEGMKLVIAEVDDCVGYTLKYSATPKKKKQQKHKNGEMQPADTNVANKEAELITLADEVYNYFDKFQPDDEESEEDECNITANSSKDGAASTNSLLESNNANESIQTDAFILDMIPNKYDPTLLPMTTIKCYPNILDRKELTKGLAQDLSKKKKERRNIMSDEVGAGTKYPCICRIQSSSNLVQQGHLMTEVLSQCISNDPNGEAFATELQRQRKRQKSQHHGGVNRGVLVRSIWSWSTSLVEWAAFTEGFDSIVVILEAS